MQKMPKTAPIKTFKVYPEEHKGVWFEVEIFSGVASLTKHAKERGFVSSEGEYAGLFTSLAAKRSKTAGCIGKLRLAGPKPKIGLVTHESFHAALRWAAWRRLDLYSIGKGKWVPAAEERTVSVGERIFEQIWRKCAR